MSSRITLPADVIDGIIGSAQKASAVAAVATNVTTSSRRDQVAFSLGQGLAAFHAVGPSKKVSDADLTQVPVKMGSMYKLMEFPDFEADDAPGILASIEANLPGIMAATADAVAVGGTSIIPTSPFTGYKTAPLTVDATVDSWEAAVSAAQAGGNASAMILDNSFKALLRSAVTEGSTSNPLTVAISDGFTVAGIPAYFRNLGSKKGVIGDFSQAVFAHYNGITIEAHRPEDDYALRVKNAVAIYAGWRCGFAVADEAAFQPIVAA